MFLRGSSASASTSPVSLRPGRAARGDGARGGFSVVYAAKTSCLVQRREGWLSGRPTRSAASFVLGIGLLVRDVMARRTSKAAVKGGCQGRPFLYCSLRIVGISGGEITRDRTTCRLSCKLAYFEPRVVTTEWMATLHSSTFASHNHRQLNRTTLHRAEQALTFLVCWSPSSAATTADQHPQILGEKRKNKVPRISGRFPTCRKPPPLANPLRKRTVQALLRILNPAPSAGKGPRTPTSSNRTLSSRLTLRLT